MKVSGLIHFPSICKLIKTMRLLKLQKIKMTLSNKILLTIGLLFILLHTSSTHAAKISRAQPAQKKASVKVINIKYWSNPNYTRVVIRLRGDAKFSHRLLKEDPKIEKPRRLYIDINRASLSPSLKQPIQITDVLLKMARAGHHS